LDPQRSVSCHGEGPTEEALLPVIAFAAGSRFLHGQRSGTGSLAVLPAKKPCPFVLQVAPFFGLLDAEF